MFAQNHKLLPRYPVTLIQNGVIHQHHAMICYAGYPIINIILGLLLYISIQRLAWRSLVLMNQVF